MPSIVERNRTRLVNIYLAELVRKTGTMTAVAELPDGSMTTLLLDADIMTKALIKLFEAPVRKILSGDTAEREITVTYGECVKIKAGKLTHIGEGFMGALISNLVERAFAERGGN